MTITRSKTKTPRSPTGCQRRRRSHAMCAESDADVVAAIKRVQFAMDSDAGEGAAADAAAAAENGDVAERAEHGGNGEHADGNQPHGGKNTFGSENHAQTWTDLLDAVVTLREELYFLRLQVDLVSISLVGVACFVAWVVNDMYDNE